MTEPIHVTDAAAHLRQLDEVAHRLAHAARRAGAAPRAGADRARRRPGRCRRPGLQGVGPAHQPGRGDPRELAGPADRDVLRARVEPGPARDQTVCARRNRQPGDRRPGLHDGQHGNRNRPGLRPTHRPARQAGWLEGETLHGSLWRAGLPRTMRPEAAVH